MQLGYASPLGPIRFDWRAPATDGIETCCVRLWLDRGAPTVPEAPAGHPMRRWLDAYFAGGTMPLPPLAPPATPFQARLRQALWAIPRGATVSYGELAARLGTAPRALGQALRANPLPVLVPCHRVVARNGLGGFACGLEWKRKLLAWETGGLSG